jgi:uncharacterized Zn finger protein
MTRDRRIHEADTWVQNRWDQALKHCFGQNVRMSRGKSYWRQGAVRNLRVSDNTVYAEVQGSRKTPYRVSFQLRPWPPSQRHRFLQELQRHPTLSRALLNNQFPSELTHVFQASNVTLFPASPRDIYGDCSCPDWGDPCKHIAAVYYAFGARLVERPLYLLALRGLDEDTLVRHLINSDGQNRLKAYDALLHSVDTMTMPPDVSSDVKMNHGIRDVDKTLPRSSSEGEKPGTDSSEAVVDVEKLSPPQRLWHEVQAGRFWKAGSAIHELEISVSPDDMAQAQDVPRTFGPPPFVRRPQAVLDDLEVLYNMVSEAAAAELNVVMEEEAKSGRD